MDRRSCFILTGQILIALTIIASTLIVTNCFKQIKFGRGTIYVKGSAERLIQSDFVKWRCSFSASAETQIEAFTKLEKDLALLQAYLLEKKIPLDAIEFSSIETSLVYQREKEYQTNKIERYILSQDFAISSPDIPLISQVAQNITTLIKEGLTIHSSPPQYFYRKLDELKIAMLGEAAKDAKLRAEELVTKSGARVGTLRSAQQGVFQITPAFSSSISDYGEYDTSSIAKRIKAVVTIEYAID